MELKEVLLRRKSCRAYEERPVEKEKLNEVVTAGSLAPLGLPRDGKPHLTVVTDPAALKMLGGLLARTMTSSMGRPPSSWCPARPPGRESRR